MSVVVEAAMLTELYCAGCEKSFTTGTRCPSCAGKLVKLVAATDSFVGRELDGRFTVMEKLGQGGMGAVYRARQHSVNREVAIKIVHASRMSDPTIIKRFLREAKLLSRLSHPNAVGVLDFGQTDDGVFYLVMELVAGHTLDDELRAVGAFPPTRVVKIGTQICDALECAHGMQIVHRDLKPANIMLIAGSRDFVKVLDFGLAKSLTAVTDSGSKTLGTPAFVSPERINNGVVDHRADLYSLGCILYLLGTGELPFHSDSADDMVAMHTFRAPPPMDGVPTALSSVIEQLLAKDPNDRYQTASEVRQALEVALASLAIDGELHASNPQLSPATGSRMVVSTTTLNAAVPAPRKVWPYVLAGMVSAALTAGVIGFAVSGSNGSMNSGEAHAATPLGLDTAPPAEVPDPPTEVPADPPADPPRPARKRSRAEDELAEPGAPPRTNANGTEGALASQSADETAPVAPPETKPVPAPETRPVPAPETKPVPAPETKPVAPPVMKPVAPPETKPVPPPEAKPVPPPAIKPAPSQPPETRPVPPRAPEIRAEPKPPATPPAPPKIQKVEPKKPLPEPAKKMPAKKLRRPPPPPAQKQKAPPAVHREAAPAPAPEPPPSEPKLPF